MLTLENVDHQHKSYRIKYKGEELLCIEGAICTEEQFMSFQPSIAHLFENGDILNYGEVIGSVNEIEFLEEYF